MIPPRDSKAWRLGRAAVPITLTRCYCQCHNTATGAFRDDPLQAAVASGCWCIDAHCPALETPIEARQCRERAVAEWDPAWGTRRDTVQPPPAEAAGGTDEDDGS